MKRTLPGSCVDFGTARELSLAARLDFGRVYLGVWKKGLAGP
jgi:hypothetical protein